MFAWGRLIHRFRWAVLGLSTALLAVSVVSVVVFPATLRGHDRFDFESGRGFGLESDQLPRTGVSLNFVFTDPVRTVDDPAFEAELDRSLAPLRASPRVGRDTVTSYFTAAAEVRSSLVSRDHHSVIASVPLNGDFESARRDYASLRARVEPGPMQVLGFGDVAISSDIDAYLADDLRRAETISLPVVLVLLLLVFRSVVASLVSLGVGVLAVVGGLAGTFLLARVTDVTPYAANIVSLIGLGVAIDYSLFIVSRFREEIAAGRPISEAVGASMATAGRAIAFSGITVAIGLSSLLFFQGTFLVSMGLAGVIVVAVSVIYALTFLPALLAVIGERIRPSPPPRLAAMCVFVTAAAMLPVSLGWRVVIAVVVGAATLLVVRLGGRDHRTPAMTPATGRGGWHRLAMWVMRRPVAVLVPCLGGLLLLGLPFPAIHLVSGGVTQLPAAAESRQGDDLLAAGFPAREQSSVDLVVRFADSPYRPDHVAVLHDLAHRFTATPGVERVDSVVSFDDPHVDLAGYQRLLASPIAMQPPALRLLERRTVGSTIATITLHTAYPWESDQAHALVRDVRSRARLPGAEVLVTGDTAFDLDFVGFMVNTTPRAVVLVMLSTMVVLFLLLGSVLLPLKAVVMNLLSLSASFGAMVWIFQQGHLSTVLNIRAEPIDPTVPILLFCIVFGLSMDYEVFLLSRIQEQWHRSGDNRAAVAEGLERSGRLVSGAAAIMVAVFFAFGLAQVLLIKAIGIGMAIAVLVDATIVRALVVPAVMRLMGRYNWWAPPVLRRFHQRLRLGGGPEPSEARADTLVERITGDSPTV